MSKRKSNAERQRDWQERFKAAGGRSIRVSADKATYAALRAYAARHGLSIQAAVIKIIKESAQ